MSVNQTDLNSKVEAYATYGTTNQTQIKSAKSNYGKTVGQPELSDEATKYYEKLKKKFGKMDFVLVSSDMKQQAQANASKYANAAKTVVLIDEEKIERMATDENFRKKYEGIISGATANLASLKQSIESTGANVKGYGMQVNDGGNTSFFAVLKKSSEAQKARIEKRAEKNREAKKAEAKKAEAKASNKSKVDNQKDTDDDETITITASSIDELLSKIQDYSLEQRSNNVVTKEEKMVGQNIDFRG